MALAHEKTDVPREELAWCSSRVGFRPLLVAMGAIVLAVICIRAQQPTIGGRVKDFTSAAQDTEGKRSVIKGSEAHALSKEVYEIINPKVTTYQADDRVDMVINSPKCNYDTASRAASSSSELSVKTAEEKFAITGVGWSWQPSESLLTISNKVVATIRKSAILTNQPSANAQSKTNRTTSTNTTVVVHSDFFVHHGEVATFTGNVLVEDGPDHLSCASLKVQLQEHGGAEQIDAIKDVVLRQQETEVRAGKAVYRVSENLIRLTENPSWRSGSREGSSARLTVNRTNNSFHAEGNVYMKLPNTNSTSSARSATPGRATPQNNSTNQFVEVYSDLFDYLDPGKDAAAGTAFYRGNVRVLQPNGDIHCKFLTVLFSPKENRLLEAIADDDVEVNSNGNRAFGNRAIYELTRDKITLSGNPHWALDERKGSSDYMIFYPRTEELLALQRVHVILPSSATGDLRTFGTTTNRPVSKASSTNAPMEVFSDIFSRQEKISVFRDNVRVLDPQGELTCSMLTVFTGASNQIQRIVADQKVNIKQQDMIATGDQAIYGLNSDTIELLGHPKITTPERTVVADSFLINRQSGTFKIRGKYRIEMKVPEKRQEQNLTQNDTTVRARR